jgi:hypothetical protein
MLDNTWRETEYHFVMCHAINSAHIETYRSRKFLEIHYTLWLKIHVSFYWHLRPDIRYMSTPTGQYSIVYNPSAI